LRSISEILTPGLSSWNRREDRMPRYQYRCKSCKNVSTISHASTEVETCCPLCNKPESLEKLLTRFRTGKTGTKKHKVGQVTEQFIKDSRQELEQQKDKLNKHR
jgi:putative FmdB family regulatory protein